MTRISFCRAPGTVYRAATPGKSLHVKGSQFNLLPAESRISVKDFFDGCALIHHRRHQLNWNARSAVDWRAAHSFGVGNDHLFNFAEPLQFPFDFQPGRFNFNDQDRTPGNSDLSTPGEDSIARATSLREDTGSSRMPSTSSRR